ncbi:uncharacterized protein [Watersipora subatra]|uniref:uncharacterized protein n=1 Tax=Watersipora subatra TaxID=2589382 RepID=UPI00355B20D3
MHLQWKNQLQDKEQLNELYRSLGLPQGSQLYGRDDQIEELSNILNFDKDTKTSLVGVYGMTGIGKSYLVKHVALKMMTDKRNTSKVLFTDASGVTTLSDVLVKLLQNPAIDLFASGSKEHMMGLLREYFISYKHQQFILIFDDLSSLMDNGESEEVQKFLNFLLKAKKEYSLKVKVVVTSQVELKPVGSEDEKKTTKSLQLSSLDENISKKLLHQDKKVRLDEKQEEMFLKECDVVDTHSLFMWSVRCCQRVSTSAMIYKT